jgi:hypothetical protein
MWRKRLLSAGGGVLVAGLVALALAVGFLARPVGAAGTSADRLVLAPVKRCGTMQFPGGYVASILVIRGRVPCATARFVLRRAKTGPGAPGTGGPRGWTCFRSVGVDPPSNTCHKNGRVVKARFRAG